jgi:hypothetical protein
MKKYTCMTLREWTIAYDLAFGRAQLERSYTLGERDFLHAMFGDLGGNESVVSLMHAEFRRMDDELANKTTEEMRRVDTTSVGADGRQAKNG